MMIEPELPVTGPVFDEFTTIASSLLNKVEIGNRYRGFHRCICGKNSASWDLVLPGGQITNSLLVHYVRDHRAEVPRSELDKLKSLAGYK